MTTPKPSLHTLCIGGPLGLLHALRVAWLQRRLSRLHTYQQRERELHAEHLRALRLEFDLTSAALLSAQHHAATYWEQL